MEYEIEALGFTGFYQGIWDQGENEYNEISLMEYGDYEYIRSLQFIDYWGFGPDYRDKIAKLFAEYYVDLLNGALGLDLKLVSQSVSSPREYNFTTDRIFCNVEIGDYDKLVNKLIKLANAPENRNDMAETIRRNHSSCSGFISFMSNDLDEWCDDYLLDSESGYFSYFIGYLANVISSGCLYANNELVYGYVSESTDYHIPQPETDEAKEEWELYLKHGDIYISFLKEYRQQHIHPNRLDWPEDHKYRYDVDWDEFKEAFTEYIENYEKEQQRKALLAAWPTIPGLI